MSDIDYENYSLHPSPGGPTAALGDELQAQAIAMDFEEEEEEDTVHHAVPEGQRGGSMHEALDASSDDAYLSLRDQLAAARARRNAALQRELERVVQDTVDIQSRSGIPAGGDPPRFSTQEVPQCTPGASERTTSTLSGRKRRASPDWAYTRDRLRMPIKKPEMYKGRTLKEYRDWITRADITFQQAPHVYRDGFAKIIWTSQYLEGEIFDRWQNWWNALPNQSEASWEEFKTLLLDELDDPVARKSDSHEKYAEAKQRDTQSCRAFLTYLETLESQMTPYTEEQKLWHYFARLRKDIRLAITDHNLIPTTRRELASLATQLEKNIAQRKGRSLADRITHPRKAPTSKVAPTAKGKREEHQPRRQETKPPPRTDVVRPATKDLSHIICYNCNKNGHYANNCPQPRRDQGPANKTPVGRHPKKG
jgi:hypothetical protein